MLCAAERSLMYSGVAKSEMHWGHVRWRRRRRRRRHRAFCVSVARCFRTALARASRALCVQVHHDVAACWHTFVGWSTDSCTQCLSCTLAPYAERTDRPTQHKHEHVSLRTGARKHIIRACAHIFARVCAHI